MSTVKGSVAHRSQRCNWGTTAASPQENKKCFALVAPGLGPASLSLCTRKAADKSFASESLKPVERAARIRN